MVLASRSIDSVRPTGRGVLSRITCLAHRWRFGAFTLAFLRALIEAQSHKAGLAQLAMVAPLRKSDLGHECRPHPMDIRTRRWIALVERRSFLLQGIQSLAQIEQQHMRVAGADFASID